MKLYDFTSAPWGSLPKREYRRRCLIEPYRQLFGEVPPDRQYWTMCGTHVRSGRPLPFCELDQLERSGFVARRQFVGVDKSEAVIAANRAVWPDVDWRCGLMEREVYRDQAFRPALIHLDTTHTPAHAARLASQVCRRVQEACLVVVNVVLRRWLDRRAADPAEFLDLFECPGPGWSVGSRVYLYRGAVNSPCLMGAYLLCGG